MQAVEHEVFDDLLIGYPAWHDIAVAASAIATGAQIFLAYIDPTKPSLDMILLTHWRTEFD